jgi:hypothetical protein
MNATFTKRKSASCNVNDALVTGFDAGVAALSAIWVRGKLVIVVSGWPRGGIEEAIQTRKAGGKVGERRQWNRIVSNCVSQEHQYGPATNPRGTTRTGQSRIYEPMSFFVEFWDYMRVRKKFWLLPVFMVMIVLGGLLVLSQGSAVAPFIYTLF